MDIGDFRGEVRKIKEIHPDWGRFKIADALGEHPSRVRRALQWLKKNEGIPNAEKSSTKDFSKNKAFVSIKSLNVLTLKDALRVAEIDTEIWEVDRYLINSWEVTMGIKSTGDIPKTCTNWQVKVWLKRKIKYPLETATEAIIERMEKYSPKYDKINFSFKGKEDKCLLEIALYDLHFGKLAWEKEVGHDFDIENSEKIYLDATIDLLNQARPRTVEKILFPVGQDFFHINNPMGITPAGGNILDVDSRFAKVIETGEMAVIKAIEYCRQIAPVDILWIPGNHDPETSYTMCRTLRAWFRHDNNINVDVSPTLRKYYPYGVNLIGFAHGSDEPMKELPRIMADEKPILWAKSKHREFHTGHIHKKKEINFISTDSWGGTTVRTIPSLTGTDYWHYKKGYVQVDRSAQSFLWHKKNGLIGSFLTHLKQKE